MCCFSRPVEYVAETRIFARFVGGGAQAVVYSMKIKMAEDLAMVLPIPVAPGATEGAMRFVDLSGYPSFFRALSNGFPKRMGYARSGGDATRGGAGLGPPPPLKVLQVGSFDASFVPTVKDFARLDERFRLPDGVWEKLGPYARYGFAVFKLRRGETQVHPMAFTFPTENPNQLFFPTVHVHDGKVHPRAEFDHELYFQAARGGLRSFAAFEESALPASRFVGVAASKGLVAGESHVFRAALDGERRNADVTLAIA